jgi:hypothetical protein
LIVLLIFCDVTDQKNVYNLRSIVIKYSGRNSSAIFEHKSIIPVIKITTNQPEICRYQQADVLHHADVSGGVAQRSREYLCGDD